VPDEGCPACSTSGLSESSGVPHLASTCTSPACAWSTHLHVCMCVGALPLVLFHLALSAVRCQVDQQRPGRRIEACPLGRQPPVRRQRKQGEVSGPVRGWPRAERRGAEGERRAPGVGGVAGAHIPPLRLVWHSLARSLTHSLTHSGGWQGGWQERVQGGGEEEEEAATSQARGRDAGVRDGRACALSGRSFSGGVP